METELDRDPNFKAYQKALEDGRFRSLGPAWVAFAGGSLVVTARERSQLFQALEAAGIRGCFVHEVNVPERVIHIRTPFIDG